MRCNNLYSIKHYLCNLHRFTNYAIFHITGFRVLEDVFFGGKRSNKKAKID
jgi:hypothetical protein